MKKGISPKNNWNWRLGADGILEHTMYGMKKTKSGYVSLRSSMTPALETLAGTSEKVEIKEKQKQSCTSGINQNTPARQQKKVYGDTLEWFMQIMSRINKMIFFAFSFMLLLSATTAASELILKTPSSEVQVESGGGKVTAIDVKSGRGYIVSDKVFKHIKNSFELSLLSSYDHDKNPIYMILVREPSRPNSLGRGYCGAGYEDFLLLLKIEKNKIKLSDEHLLQSCLYTTSLRAEEADDDPKKAIRQNADGSYDFEMLDDQYGGLWNIKVIKGKFLLREKSKITDDF